MAGRAVREKKRRYAETIRKLERLHAIIRAHFRIGTILELEKIARIYLRELIDTVHCDGCAIIRIDEDEVRILAERGFLKMYGDMELNADQSTIKHIVDTKQAIFTGDILSSPAAGYIPRGSSINSLIWIPIMVNDAVRGIIHLDSINKNAFNNDDIEFTRLLSKEISVAFEQSFQNSHVRNLLEKDGLTGCFNHSKFDRDIVAEIATAKEYEEQLSLLMIDIDWFKRYSDFHGHPKGDTLLKKLVAILTSNIRAFNKIYRYGEDEFAILIADTDKEQALVTARRLQRTVEQAQFEGEKESQPNGKITVSIGVATFPSDANHSDKLIETANSALYRAKESGRNQVCAFDLEE